MSQCANGVPANGYSGSQCTPYLAALLADPWMAALETLMLCLTVGFPKLDRRRTCGVRYKYLETWNQRAPVEFDTSFRKIETGGFPRLVFRQHYITVS